MKYYSGWREPDVHYNIFSESGANHVHLTFLEGLTLALFPGFPGIPTAGKIARGVGETEKTIV